MSGYPFAVSAAAFFDLDRTLLRRASGPALSQALREVGVRSGHRIPGEGLLFGIFDLIGETRPSMMLARQGVRFSAGWDTELVAEAGEIAASRLVAEVLPYARTAMEMHRRQGRKLVIATTSPADLVRPLADALGFDDIVATRYARTDGVLAGEVDGHYVWGKGKLAAAQEWADANSVDLAESYAYSDSYYDLPLLKAVGHPVAVNPDPRLAVAAAVRRWPVRHFDSPEGVPQFAGVEPLKALTMLARPELAPYARFDFAGLGHIPEQGPAIIAANHRSYFDVFTLGVALAKRGRLARFVSKRELFDAPLLGAMVSAFGAVPVDRGSGSDAPLIAAAEALEAGEAVVILPQGTIPRGRAFFDPRMVGRSGVARLQKMSGAPIVPVSLWGTENVWPRSARMPKVLNVVHPPTVRVRAGEALLLPDGISSADGVELVMSSIFDLHPVECKVAHEPTPEELARTFPPGHDQSAPGSPNGTEQREGS
ncbi:MAG: HAD-IB family hydrolase [Acidimicrobiaceae bacterium]|nr:HAD-IB family hydrolase [Acidimicrobiaceae bacterium]